MTYIVPHPPGGGGLLQHPQHLSFLLMCLRSKCLCGVSSGPDAPYMHDDPSTDVGDNFQRWILALNFNTSQQVQRVLISLIFFLYLLEN